MLLYEWKRTLKRPTLFLFVIIFPIVLLLVTGLAIYSLAKVEVNQNDILVLYEDETFETYTLIDTLDNIESNYYFFICHYYSNCTFIRDGLSDFLARERRSQSNRYFSFR